MPGHEAKSASCDRKPYFDPSDFCPSSLNSYFEQGCAAFVCPTNTPLNEAYALGCRDTRLNPRAATESRVSVLQISAPPR